MEWFIQAGIAISLLGAMAVALLGGEFSGQDASSTNPFRSFCSLFLAGVDSMAAWKWLGAAMVFFAIWLWMYQPDIKPGGFYESSGPVNQFTD